MRRDSLIRRASARAHALLTLIATMLTLWTIWSTMVLPNLSPKSGWVQTAQSAAIRAALWLLPSGLYLWKHKGKRSWDGLGLALPPTWQRGLAAMSLVMIASLAISIDVASKLDVSVPEVWPLLWQRQTFEGFQTPFFEELVFRGVIFSELLALSGLSQEASLLPLRKRMERAWLANLGASVVFVGMHWPWWIFTEGLGIGLLIKSLPVFLLSLVLGVVFLRGKSIWPCILLHWLNNSLAQLAGT